MTRDVTPRVVLIGNYRPDQQQSMQRFVALLERELRYRHVDVTVLIPRTLLGGLETRARGMAKWLGYIDKLVLFPWTLRRVIRRIRRSGRPTVVHVCDHSNAVYTRYLRRVPHLVTCNDLLAVRSARGEFPEHRTRWSGRILQRMILGGLKRAQAIVCISDATRRDVERVCGRRDRVDRAYMGLNYPFIPLDPDEAAPRIDRLLGSRHAKFLLHVGGNQWYKNRLGVLKIYEEMRTQAKHAPVPRLVMVGPHFTGEMREFIRLHKLSTVIELCDVAGDDLNALYSAAELLLFPSLAEGFGWPVLEAMAAGCRVVTSNRAPLTEVGGSAAVYIDPTNVATAAAVTAAVLRESTAEKRARIARGLQQQAAFSTAAMVDTYLAIYRSLTRDSVSTHGAPIAAV